MIKDLIAEHGDVDYVSDLYGIVTISFEDGFDYDMTSKEYEHVKSEVLSSVWREA